MLYQFSTFGFHMLICCIIILCIMVYTFKHRENKIKSFLFANSVVTFIYLLAYAIYCFLIPADLKVMCLCVEFVVYVLTYTFMLLICYDFFDNKSLYNRKSIISLCIIPLFTLFCALSNPWTGLIATPIFNTGAVEGVTFIRGIGAWLTFAYGFILYGVIIVYCIKEYSSLEKQKKLGALLIMLSPILAIISLVYILSGIFNTSINFVPLSCFISTVLLFIAVYFTSAFNKFPLSWKNFVDNADVGMVLFDLEKRVVYYNPKFDQIIGLDKDLTGLKITELAAPKPAVDFIITEDDFVEYWDDPRQMWIQVNRSWVYDEDNVLIGENHIISDVTRLKDAEIKAKLHAQEAIEANNHNVVLLKEVHHRVKNNLQLITSFINLEKKFHKDNPEEILEITKKRIDSLALIHERIYNEEDLKDINVNAFFSDFIRSLYALSDDKGITFIDNTQEDLLLSVDIVTPLVLILNELVTNTFKYAFDDDFTGLKEVRSSLRLKKIDGKLFCECHYSDTGKGLPDDFDINKLNSLGIIVIRELSGQLDGDFEFYNDNGCNFNLLFPVPDELSGYLK